ncbi:hypothetical protein GCM10020219_084060 [Nonomuraea dietziae]
MFGQLVTERGEQDPGLGEDDRADGEVGLLHRKPGDQDIDVAIAQGRERADERVVAYAQRPLRVADAERLPVRAQVVGVTGQHADAQRLGAPLRGQLGSLHALAQLAEGGSQIVVQPFADRGEADAAAGALEQLGADRALLFPDRLADPRRTHT